MLICFCDIWIGCFMISYKIFLVYGGVVKEFMYVQQLWLLGNNVVGLMIVVGGEILRWCFSGRLFQRVWMNGFFGLCLSSMVMIVN